MKIRNARSIQLTLSFAHLAVPLAVEHSSLGNDLKYLETFKVFNGFKVCGIVM